MLRCYHEQNKAHRLSCLLFGAKLLKHFLGAKRKSNKTNLHFIVNTICSIIVFSKKNVLLQTMLYFLQNYEHNSAYTTKNIPLIKEPLIILNTVSLRHSTC